ncbi:hypothetical protein I203_104720 [Kwoniella mangroviensis CBS 8507]|uniref:uncharacterized protein n=1 Tax=Kwoniella mangroviensis CBS 8507 TaxID=1296122 RepID=UPI00080D2E45|nr:uncharacterized protein I203_00335 [Kwoniella mangroviensis CBS 8507]OCF70203.1 hypothetical protein I203_00335 [Kwoniella mangroviensis CBS 8507]
MADTARRRAKAIVIGAGVGGTATAARLAHVGFDVEVYEKNEMSGGRCSLIHHEGYRFDQGPSLLLLPPLFHQLYNDLGTKLEDHVDLIQCDPNYVIHYHDGEKVTLSSDRAQLGAEVEKWEGKGGSARLEEFLREAGLHAQLSYEHVLGQPFPNLLSMLRPDVLINLLKLHPFGSLWGRCARYFRTERMRRAFSFGSMYLGSSPFDAPGTYTLLQWTETCEGIWYPKGGFHSVVQSLVDISQRFGAKYHFSTPISSVTHNSRGRATGVRLENGDVREADVVVVNADLVWAHNHLFERSGVGIGQDKEKKQPLDPSLAKRLNDKPHSCSSISFYWALDSTIPSLNAHNIFLAEDYKGSFDDIFKRKGMPREPSFYVNVPSRVDLTAAPAGKDAIVVLVPVGHLHNTTKDQQGLRTFSEGSNVPDQDTQDWPALVDRARTQVIEVMEARLGIKGVKGKIVWEGVNTPQTWKDKFNLTHGSILGITHDFFNVLSFRQQARHPSLKGAYFVGASAHPGTGVPIAIAGSRLCTQAILSDLSIPLPHTYTHPISSINRSNPLNTIQHSSILYTLENVSINSLPYIIGSFITICGCMAYTLYYKSPPGFIPQRNIDRFTWSYLRSILTTGDKEIDLIVLIILTMVSVLLLAFRLVPPGEPQWMTDARENARHNENMKKEKMTYMEKQLQAQQEWLDSQSKQNK